MHPRIAACRQRGIGPKGWFFFLRPHKFWLASEREFLKVRKGLHALWQDAGLVPFLRIKAVAPVNLRKIHLKFLELNVAQPFPRQSFGSLVEEWHACGSVAGLGERDSSMEQPH